jgi:uncharacterized protein
MKILDNLMALLDFNTPVRDIRQGVFHTGVMTRHCGLAATLPKDALKQPPPMVKAPGFLLDKTAEELAALSYSEHILEAAMGMACINSLLTVEMDRCVELNAGELILEKGTGKNVAIVGHFPFLSKVREKTKNLWIIEKNPQEGDLEESEADQLIPQADVVAITGTALTNHTLEHLLSLCDPGAYVVILGDSVPLSPVLFDYHVDAVSGTKAMDAEMVLRCVSQGANYRQIKGVKRLTMFKSR